MATEHELGRVTRGWGGPAVADLRPGVRQALRHFGRVREADLGPRLELFDYPVVGFGGVGSYGAVFRATGRDGGPLALKVFDIQQPDDVHGLLSVVREAAAGAQPLSEYIVRYHRLVVEAPPAGAPPDAPPACYLVREWAPGSPPTPAAVRDHPADALGAFRCLARGLWDLHDRHHLVHRDVKPQNAVADGPRAKWVDLGQVRLNRPTGGGPDRAGATRSEWQPTYPPEAWTREGLNEDRWRRPGDVFAFGVTLYWLLTGAWPWETAPVGPLSRDATELLARTRSPLAAVVRPMLLGDPARRPSMKQVAEQLGV